MRLTYDLHLHSCLSPCAQEDMTPANLAAMCALAGLNIAALTDHNTAGNCAAFAEAAGRHGLIALPGMELTTAEEVHVLCFLPDLDTAKAFGALVHDHLPDIANQERVFGKQLYMDSGDSVLGEERRLLTTATDIGIYEVAGLMERFGGVAVPAHIDRPSFSVFSNLGFWDKAFGFSLAECTGSLSPAFFLQHPNLSGVRLITGSDAHSLNQIRDADQAMEIPEASTGQVLRWLRCGEDKIV